MEPLEGERVMDLGEKRARFRRLLPFSRWQWNLLTAALAFGLGAYFDLTQARLDPAGALAGSGAFLLFARVVGGAILAALVLGLLRAGRDLLGLGRVDGRQMLLLALALNGVAALYLCTARTVYFWDGAGYWTVARNLSQQWLGRSQISQVLQSTIHLDYNYLLAFPISLVMRVLGGSRAVFVLSIVNLYVLPGVWALCVLGKVRRGGGLVLCALFPALLYLGLVGFVDVAACSLGLWAYMIYTSDRPAVSRGVFAGALLVGSFLLRRYFFFFAVSFGVGALAKKLLFERKDWRDFGALFGSCAVCAVYLTPNFLLEKVLGTNYADLYSAYDLGLRSDLLLFCRYFGLAVAAVALVCAVIGLAQGEGRPVLVLALVQGAVCFGAFVCVQSHGQQHLLLYLPALAVLFARSGLGVKGPWPAALAALVFVNCLIPQAQPGSVGELKRPDLLPSFIFYGPQRSDMEQLIALADFVDGLSAQEPRTAVVLASSFVFNSETLTNLRPSLGLREPQVRTTIQYHGTVDKRDAFNWNTPGADYLIVGDPVQVHLGEENQRVVSLLARDVLEGVGPGEAYEALPETFALEGVTVRLYRRSRDWTVEEYRSISERLQGYYPDYAQLYRLPDWVN